MSEDLAERSRRRVDALEARLRSPTSESEAQAMKDEILYLRRDLERERKALDGVLAGMDALLLRIDRKGKGSTPAAAPEFRPNRPTPAGRADHLGASTYIEKGWNLISAGDFGAAEESLLKALKLAPDELEALSLLGWAQMYLEKYDDALLAFQKVLAREPTSSIARINIGYICLKKGIFGEAIEHLSRVIRGGGDRKSVLYANFYLGLLYLEREMYADARNFLQRARALGPNLIEAAYELGRACWFDGEREAAQQAWREGHAANKFNQWGKRCAEMLDLVNSGGEPPR